MENNPHEESAFETLKKYGSWGLEKTKEATQAVITKVQDPEFQHEVKEKSKAVWETTKDYSAQVYEKAKEAHIADKIKSGLVATKEIIVEVF